MIGFLIALGIGYAFYRIIVPTRKSTKATDTALHWLAWTMLVVTTSLLGQAFNGHEDGYITLLTCMTTFGLLSSAIGWCVGKVIYMDKSEIISHTKNVVASLKVTPSAPIKNAEERLSSIKALHEKGLINQDEYDLKRKEIVENL